MALAQMAALGTSARCISAHGSAGQLRLGGTLSMPIRPGRTSEVLAALAAHDRRRPAGAPAIILAGSRRAQFAANPAKLTGADVAASNNRTERQRRLVKLETVPAMWTALLVLAAGCHAQYHHDLVVPLPLASNADSGAGKSTQRNHGGHRRRHYHLQRRYDGNDEFG